MLQKKIECCLGHKRLHKSSVGLEMTNVTRYFWVISTLSEGPSHAYSIAQMTIGIQFNMAEAMTISFCGGESNSRHNISVVCKCWQCECSLNGCLVVSVKSFPSCKQKYVDMLYWRQTFGHNFKTIVRLMKLTVSRTLTVTTQNYHNAIFLLWDSESFISIECNLVVSQVYLKYVDHVCWKKTKMLKQNKTCCIVRLKLIWSPEGIRLSLVNLPKLTVTTQTCRNARPGSVGDKVPSRGSPFHTTVRPFNFRFKIFTKVRSPSKSGLLPSRLVIISTSTCGRFENLSKPNFHHLVVFWTVDAFASVWLTKN